MILADPTQRPLANRAYGHAELVEIAHMRRLGGMDRADLSPADIEGPPGKTWVHPGFPGSMRVR